MQIYVVICICMFMYADMCRYMCVCEYIYIHISTMIHHLYVVIYMHTNTCIGTKSRRGSMAVDRINPEEHENLKRYESNILMYTYVCVYICMYTYIYICICV
jgi:hypothetical protein